MGTDRKENLSSSGSVWKGFQEEEGPGRVRLKGLEEARYLGKWGGMRVQPL